MPLGVKRLSKARYIVNSSDIYYTFLSANLERKWMAKSSAECDEVVDVCEIFSSVLIFDQRALESPILDWMASDQ